MGQSSVKEVTIGTCHTFHSTRPINVAIVAAFMSINLVLAASLTNASEGAISSVPFLSRISPDLNYRRRECYQTLCAPLKEHRVRKKLESDPEA